MPASTNSRSAICSKAAGSSWGWPARRPRLTTFGWSIAEQDTSDGQFGSAYEGARYGNLNLLYYPVPGIMVGGELVYGELELKDGSEADDTRLQMSFKYNFD